MANLSTMTEGERRAYLEGCAAERTLCWLRIMKAVKRGELSRPEECWRKGLLLAAALVNDDAQTVESLQTEAA